MVLGHVSPQTWVRVHTSHQKVHITTFTSESRTIPRQPARDVEPDSDAAAAAGQHSQNLANQLAVHSWTRSHLLKAADACQVWATPALQSAAAAAAAVPATVAAELA